MSAGTPSNRASAAPSVWPDGARCAVLVTFDLDGETGFMSHAPDRPLLPVQESQGRFGPRVGVPALLEMLAEFGLRSTFFVPSLVVERYPETIEAVLEAGSEVGAHGHAHEIPGTVSEEEEERILVKSVEIIERATGERPMGYRAPFGQLSPGSIGILERHGFDYESSMMDDVFPYLHPSVAGGRPVVELPIHWVLVDASFMQFHAGQQARPIHSAAWVLELWKEEFDGLYERGGLMNLILHPQLVGRPARVRMLRELLTYVSGFPGVWMPLAKEVAGHWRERAGGDRK